jgi:hypothetical protein
MATQKEKKTQVLMDKFIIEMWGKCFDNGEKGDIYRVHDRAKKTPLLEPKTTIMVGMRK